MRILQWKILMLSALFVNIMMAFTMWYSFDKPCDCSVIHNKHSSYMYAVKKEHRNELNILNVTDAQMCDNMLIVIREFEHFDNDITETTSSILTALPCITIKIITDKIPYPRINFDRNILKNVEVISLKPLLNHPSELHRPSGVLEKEHIMIFPDSVRVHNSTQIKTMLQTHFRYPDKIIAAPLQNTPSSCLGLNISMRYWTMKYGQSVQDSDCDALEGPHVLLMTKTLLMQFGFPFTRPFLPSVFIQASLLKIKTHVIQEVSFQNGKTLFVDPHLKWKHEVSLTENKRSMYENFGIKKIIFPASKVEWHGCTKTTSRCFGTVVNKMPEYLFEGRWTPPCCLENLRKTTRYVFSILEKCEVRYWLEGGSLLGAARTGDIIPWDYDVDVGIYRDDIKKCEWLKNSLQQSIIDTQGFLWEKAREGDFIRVQFSATNHLHVDIFPFYSRNGTMTKDTWFPDHRQDMEFPERFLQPLSWIKFVGMKASTPNNYKEFLELKFGKGVIGKPEYPNPDIMAFSRKFG